MMNDACLGYLPFKNTNLMLVMPDVVTLHCLD